MQLCTCYDLSLCHKTKSLKSIFFGYHNNFLSLLYYIIFIFLLNNNLNKNTYQNNLIIHFAY